MNDKLSIKKMNNIIFIPGISIPSFILVLIYKPVLLRAQDYIIRDGGKGSSLCRVVISLNIPGLIGYIIHAPMGNGGCNFFPFAI